MQNKASPLLVVGMSFQYIQTNQIGLIGTVVQLEISFPYALYSADTNYLAERALQVLMSLGLLH